MTSLWWGVVAVLVLWGAVALWRGRRESRHRGGAEPWQRSAAVRDDPDDAIDYETLRAAENEVKDLGTDVKGRPVDDQVGDDWGPGTPKPPYA